MANSGCRDYILFDHSGTEVVRTERERYLAYRGSLRNPGRLDMREIVQNQP
jgi:hypothetical protein